MRRIKVLQFFFYKIDNINNNWSTVCLMFCPALLQSGLKNYCVLFFDGSWNIYSLIDGGGEELAEGLKPIRKGNIVCIIFFFNVCTMPNSFMCWHEWLSGSVWTATALNWTSHYNTSDIILEQFAKRVWWT